MKHCFEIHGIGTHNKRLFFIFKVLQGEVEGDVKLMFLRQTKTPGVYTWPPNDDVSWQPLDDIKAKIAASVLLSGRALELKFDISEINMINT